MPKNKILIFVFSIIGVQLVGYAGTFFTIPSIQTWYSTIAKPAFNPPNWIFGPVWTILFLMIGVSLALVLASSKNNKYRKPALIAFIIQLALNLAWSFIFFYLHRPGLAAIEIFILLASIILNIYLAAKVNKPAAWLLVPYLLWVSFASILNLTIWRLN